MAIERHTLQENLNKIILTCETYKFSIFVSFFHSEVFGPINLFCNVHKILKAHKKNYDNKQMLCTYYCLQVLIRVGSRRNRRGWSENTINKIFFPKRFSKLPPPHLQYGTKKARTSHFELLATFLSISF